MQYRNKVNIKDIIIVKDILSSTNFFNEEEIDIAVDLVRECLNKGKLSGYEFIFAEEGKETIAYSCFGKIAGTKSSYDLYWIATHSDYRGKGIGKELLNKTLETINNLNGENVYIETSSREQYKPTRAFYENYGCKKEVVIENFYGPGDGKVLYSIKAGNGKI